MKKNLAIVFGITKDFTFALANVLIGIKKNCQPFWDDIVVYHDGISEDEQACLNSILPCEFVLFDTGTISDKITEESLKNYSLLCLSKFECFDLLSKYRKIIWHDVDILVQKDFSNLLQYGNKSGFSATQSPSFRVEQNFFGLMPGYDMLRLLYNSGILVLSDQLPSYEGLTGYCYKQFNQNSKKIRYLDQGILNMLIQDYKIEVEQIDLDMYCCHPTTPDYKDAAIIHAYGSNKFWNSAKLKRQFPEWEKNNMEWLQIKREARNENGENVPTVSVIMSVYERTNYLDAAMTSILNQTFSNFEFIIVIEKSARQNEIRQMLEDYGDSRIVTICNKDRLGFASSLNEGIDAARGKYIARMDDDDISETSRFIKQVAFLDSHPDISVVGTWMTMFGQSQQKCTVPETHEELLVWALRETPLYHPTVMIRKADLDKNGFRYNPEYFTEDYELWCRITGTLKLANIQEHLHLYRASGQNATATKQQMVMGSHLSIMRRTFRENLGLEFTDNEMLLLRLPHIINECYNSEEANQLRISVIKRIFKANSERHVYNEDQLIKYLGDFRPDLKTETKSKLRNHPVLYKLARAVYKFFSGIWDAGKKKERRNTSLFLRVKMRVLPPSSRSFHDHISLLEGRANGILTKMDALEGCAGELLARQNMLEEQIGHEVRVAQAAQIEQKTVWIEQQLEKQTARLEQQLEQQTARLERQVVRNLSRHPVNNKAVLDSLLSLVETTSTRETREITKHFLNSVEIEAFSFCNRQCWFCPNKNIDRQSENHFMDEDIYMKILAELQSIDYSGTITYSRYNEPLADRIILKRIRQAREYCPNAYLRTNTNGDYLTRDYLNELAQAGLNHIEIQCYYKEDEELNRYTFEKSVREIAEKLQIDAYTLEHCDPEKYIISRLSYSGLNLFCAANNFKKVASNRGGTLDNMVGHNRTTNCLIPFKNLYIDWNGSYMLCCNLRSDVNEHSGFILGNASSNSIFDVFCGEKMKSFRRILGVYGEKPEPCSSCNFILDDNDLELS